MTDPGSILAALNANLLELAEECHFATLVVTLINSDRHELTIANAGHVPPFLRRLDRRIESLAEEVSWFPLWIDPSQTYENGIVPIGLGEVVTFQSGGVTGIVNDEWNLDDDLLRQAIAQAPHGAALVGQSILEAISRFRGSRAQVDDITLLCLGRVVPTAADSREGFEVAALGRCEAAGEDPEHLGCQDQRGAIQGANIEGAQRLTDRLADQTDPTPTSISPM